MNKVYLVIESYLYGRDLDSNVFVYESREKALEKFALMVKTEKEKSWMKNISNYPEDSYYLEEDETSFYYYDNDDLIVTSIKVVEKEAL